MTPMTNDTQCPCFPSLIFSCESSSTTTTDANPAAASGDSVAPAPTNPQASTEMAVKLACREIRNLDDISPLSEIQLIIGSQTIIVDSASTCAEITPDAWDNFEIPKDAKAAVGGWWAGAGDYYYLKIEGADAVVMYGWAEEGADEKDMYQYKEVKRAKLVASF